MTATAEKTVADLEGLDSYIQGVMERWKVPGLSLAVVKDGEVVLQQGFGFRDVEAKLPVTTRTLFAIGSSTKAFTTLTMAMLVDEGKLDWDTPVRTYLPWFALHDTFATDRITPRDLVTHRSGLPRHDLLWYNNSTETRREVIERLRYLPPNADFRSIWQYQNLMYLTAGYLAAELAGTTWEKLIEERIFIPLGMESSNHSVSASQLSDDHAHPYEERDGKVQEVPFRNLDLVGPAGSINSNVEDMTHWLLFQLHHGRHNGRSIVSDAQASEMHRGQMVMPAPYYPLKENAQATYGLGWFVETYNGDTLIHHGGAIDGFLGLVAFLPDHNAGVVVQTNLGGNPVPFIVAYHVLDLLRGRDPSDTEAQIRKIHDEAKAALAKAKDESWETRVKDTAPSHPLEEYVGQYENPGYGTISIGRNEDGLTYMYHHETFPLRHVHYDIFDWLEPLNAVRFPVSFGTGLKGDIDRLWIAIEPTMGPAEFSRAADPSMRERRFLERFTGEYEIMGRDLTVALEGDHALVAMVAGQPKFVLEPYRGTEFKVKGIDGHSIRFIENEAGVVIGAVSIQPTGAFEVTRKNIEG